MEHSARITKGILFVGIIILMFASLTTRAPAIAFNPENEGLGIRCDPQVDTYTLIDPQVCTFEITQIQTVQEQGGQTYSDDSYNDGDMPTEWGCMEYVQEVGGYNQKYYYSKVLKTDEPIIWTAMGSTAYPSRSNNSEACLELVQESLSADGRGPGNAPEIKRTMEQTTIGQLNFDVMAHLNVSSEKYGYEPYAQLHFVLNDQTGWGESLHLVFQTEYAGSNNYSLHVYYLDYNLTTGEKNVKVELFEGAYGNFNWLNVQVFFDLYNDVYNVTIAQYNLNFKDWLVAPKSTIVRGHQYSDDYKMTNTGYRMATAQLADTVDFWIESKKDVPDNGWKSSAYVDNLALNYWRFPAVYANVQLENATTQEYLETGLSYMNNSIISCYEPPKYPKATDVISYSQAYLLNSKNPGLLTTWNWAPQWQYAFPLVATTTNQELNVLSILNVINDLDYPIEEKGVIDPSLDSFYVNQPGSSIADKYFEFDSDLSYEYHYVFKARYSTDYMVVDYYSDLSRAGLLKQVLFYKEALTDLPYIKFIAKSEGHEYEQTRGIPGYSIPWILLSTIATLGVLSTILKKKKRIE